MEGEGGRGGTPSVNNKLWRIYASIMEGMWMHVVLPYYRPLDLGCKNPTARWKWTRDVKPHTARWKWTRDVKPLPPVGRTWCLATVPWTWDVKYPLPPIVGWTRGVKPLPPVGRTWCLTTVPWTWGVKYPYRPSSKLEVHAHQEPFVIVA